MFLNGLVNVIGVDAMGRSEFLCHVKLLGILIDGNDRDCPSDFRALDDGKTLRNGQWTHPPEHTMISRQRGLNECSFGAKNHLPLHPIRKRQQLNWSQLCMYSKQHLRNTCVSIHAKNQEVYCDCGTDRDP
jgi:hypothetical protein